MGNLIDLYNDIYAHTIPVKELVGLRNKALRRGAWFRVLDKTERAILNLTIRCVERIKSPRLAEMVRTILSKLRDAMKGRVERLMEAVGFQLAQNLSKIAKTWGNESATQWAEDIGFIRYLVVVKMNDNALFR